MEHAHLELSIDVGSEPITGSVVAERDTPRPFSGWMELAAAIEAARVAEEHRAHPRVGAPKD